MEYDDGNRKENTHASHEAALWKLIVVAKRAEQIVLEVRLGLCYLRVG